MVALGKTTDGGSASTSAALRQVVSSATAASSGTLVDGRARVWLVTAATVNTKFVIYGNTGSAPGALLAQSDVKVLATGTETEQLFTFSGINLIPIVLGTIYWLGVAWNAATTMNWSRDGTAGGIQQGTVTTGPTPPNPFGTPSALAGPLDAYINYNLPGGADTSQRKRRRWDQLAAVLCEPRM